MTDEQMELGFGGRRVRRVTPRRQARRSRGAWWFAWMRQIVDQALDWQPTPPPRPEQIWFPE